MPVATATVRISAVPGLPLVRAGDDLAQIVGDALARNEPPADGDLLVVAQKIVSKAEGRMVRLADVRPDAEDSRLAEASCKDPAIAALIRAEAEELMRVRPGVIVVRHRLGPVLANAGIDASNVAPGEEGAVLLWPVDPDASARRLRVALEERFDVRLAVIVSDSLGRAWRLGTTGTAIGASGIRPLRDRRGETDLFGRELQATVIGLADEIAGAASLVMGEGAEGLPVALVRGATFERDEEAGLGAILRPLAEDLFR